MAGSVSRDRDLAVLPGDADDDFEGIDIRALVDAIKRRWVLLGGLSLIVVALLWRIEFLSHLYFRLDDFIDLDKAIQSPFDWSYLTYNGVGHLIIGVRAIGWLLARTTLYNWGLDSAVDLVLVGLSGLAALRMLRTMFGERPAILIPLTVYLFCPLTMPGLGEWSSALEAIPLQLATFMAVDAHVHYLRTARRRYFYHVVLWVLFGLVFFEKGLVLPPLLFAITAAFFTGEGSWLDGMRVTLVRLWRDWAVYAVLMAGYVVILAQSLSTSRVRPSVPASGAAVWHLTWGLVGKTFLPGAFGGPWRWFGGGTYALSSPPIKMVILSLAAAVILIGTSIWFHKNAWRAWAILAGWIVVADLLPIVVGRVNNYPLDLLASETRYVADAVPILALCIGLAFWPLTDEPAVTGARVPAHAGRNTGQLAQYAAGSLGAVFLFGSLWSVQAYQNRTASTVAASYVRNATWALEQVPVGAVVADEPVPAQIILNHDGSSVLASQFIGDIERNHFGHPVRWVAQPHGTIDGLRIFGPDGRLYLARVTGAMSSAVPATTHWHGCWPARHRTIAVKLATPAPSTTSILRIGYIWFSAVSSTVTVNYGQTIRMLDIRPGLHAGYVPVSGSAETVVIKSFGVGRMCVGDVQVGSVAPDTSHPAFPAAG
jgi:hypothetical protein